MHSHTLVKLVIVGLGNIGRRFLQVLVDKSEHLRAQYGLTFQVVGAADSRGAAVDPARLDLAQIIALKEQGHSVAEYPQRGQPGMLPLDVVQQADADALCEASPVDLETGEPGLSCMRAAMGKGMHVVTPNKGPLVLAYGELTALAKEQGVRLLFCGTVAGGLPAVNLGRRDLAAATIHRLEGLLNLTANYILTRMAQDGSGYDQALAEAQAAGHAEADPSLDVEGWDAASKLVILAHSVLGHPARLADVAVEGIAGITAGNLQRAAAAGKRVKLVAAAERDGGGYRLSVRPTWLEADHPLAQLGAMQMGIVYHTDIMGTISAAIVEETPVPTAAAMLRDVIGIYRPGSA